MNIDNPIIFLGLPRSGTTIISETIMRHKELAFPSRYSNSYYKYPIINIFRNFFSNSLWELRGEKKQLNQVSYLNKYLFKPSEAYKMWNYLTKLDVDFSRNFLFNQIPTEGKKRIIRNYFKKIVKYQNKNRLAFKITGPSRIEYLLSIFPKAYFVHIKRDYIPTISSLLKVHFWKERGYSKLWWQGAYSDLEIQWAKEHHNDPISLTTFQLIKCQKILQLEIEKYNPNYLEINYEDFTDNPEEIIKKILFFSDLSDYKFTGQFLKDFKIINRNKSENEYFNKEELKKIKSIIETDTLKIIHDKF